MTAATLRPQRSLAIPLGFSFVLHVGAAAALVFARSGSGRVALPAVYRVQLVAAAPGEAAAGVVNPPKVAPDKAAPAARAKPVPPPSTKRAPAPKTAKATPTAPKPSTPADRAGAQPKAAGGDEGGKGADVANVKTEGIDFPFPAYLENIVRQIALRFPKQWPQAYTAEYQFIIRRDGSVVGIRMLSARAPYEFRIAAQGAIEGAGSLKLFGPLPEGYADDALSVVFSFDPRILRR